MPGYIRTLFSLALSVLQIAILSPRCAVLVPNRPENPFIRALEEITEPILVPYRRVIRRLGMFDLAPFAALLGIGVVAGQPSH